MGRGRPKKHKYKRLTQAQRGRILGLGEEGVSFMEISRRVGCTDTCAARLIKKFTKTKTTEDLKRAPRSRVTTPRQDRTIKRLHKQNPKSNAIMLTKKFRDEEGEQICSVQTVRNRLKEGGLNGRVARHKPLITEVQAARRLEWALHFKDYTAKDWENILFSDESPFTLFPECGRKYIWRLPGEEYKKEYLIPTVKFGGGKIQVWGVISGPLYWIQGKLTGAKYRENLKGHLAPFLRKLKQEKGKNFIFQHDNDPKHTSNVVKNYLSNQQFDVLPWASQSADLNPIENCWDQVKVQIEARPDRASSLPDVFRILQEEWNKISLDYLQNLISSMPRRCKAVIDSNGYSTKY